MLASRSMGRLWARGPSPSHCDKVIPVLLPIVESLRIEVCAVWPLDRLERLIELNGVEQRQILERSKHFPLQNGPKIDALPGAVVELKRQRVRPNDVEPLDAVEGMTHGVILGSAQWLDLERRLAGLQEGVSRHAKCYRRTNRRAINGVTEAGVPEEGTGVGPQATAEYLGQARGRYLRAKSRTEKGQLLTEAMRVTGYHRTALIRAWGRPERVERARRRGRVRRYGPAVVRALKMIWEAAGYPWSMRLKALLPLWLPWARKRLALSKGVEAQVRAISARQIDRVLAPDKRRIRKRMYGRTKPGTLLKHHIPIKTDHWDVTEPGFTEVDLVSHSGERADGDFLHSLDMTDIHTTWVETAAVLGKSQVRVQEALEQLRQQLPFALRGIDSDNGSEFINAHLHGYCTARKIQFTRGRPYKKDDNAHVEQKNWTHVRKHMGYLRYDTETARTAMNDVYADLRLLQNLFLPSVKLPSKERVGARVRRRYGVPRTPLERVQACPQAHATAVAALVALRDRLDPFTLAARIAKKLERVYALASSRGAQVGRTGGGADAAAKTAPASAPLKITIKPPLPSVTPCMARRGAVR